MQRISAYFIGGLLVAAACGTAYADEQDHARWFVEDTTPQARYNTLKKDAQGGYREALSECRTLPRSEKAFCAKQASANFRTDMTNAKAVLAR
jgi:hypothetical protein